MILSRLLTAAVAAGVLGTAAAEPRMIVIGFDGMDPRIVRGMWEEGKLPNLKKLADAGGFSPLWSSIPPQSPVAWSNFITGMNPGGHGIFDFIHRRADTYQPYLSMSETLAPEGLTIPLGKYSVPLSGGGVVLLRRGKAFWEYLEDAGIPATVFKMPSNFPPAGEKTLSVSGMGTPDLLGTYGTYQYFTTDPADIPADYGGARMELVFPEGDRIDQALEGPPDNYLEGNPRIMIPFTVWIDPVNPVARIDIYDRQIMLPAGDWVPEDRLGPREGEDPEQRILLRQGEWSDWVTVEFNPLPLPSI
nr:alkaline phosphatase family protein [bacterium]